MRSNITIKAAKDEIIIKLNPELTQEDIIEKLKKKLTELKRLYKTAQNPIYVTGKDLSKNEELEIKNLILDKIDVEIKFDSDMNLGLHGIKKSFSKSIIGDIPFIRYIPFSFDCSLTLMAFLIPYRTLFFLSSSFFSLRMAFLLYRDSLSVR